MTVGIKSLRIQFSHVKVTGIGEGKAAYTGSIGPEAELRLGRGLG